VGANRWLQAGLVNSLTGDRQRFEFEKAPKTKTLQEIIEEMGEG
jgi:hypothetical protein